MIDYLVEVKELRHRDGARDVIQVDVDGFNTVMKQATVNQGLGTAIIVLLFSLANVTTFDAMCTLYCNAVGGVPYSISVKALTVTGCGPQQQIYCFTNEGGTTFKSPFLVLMYALVHSYF